MPRLSTVRRLSLRFDLLFGKNPPAEIPHAIDRAAAFLLLREQPLEIPQYAAKQRDCEEDHHPTGEVVTELLPGLTRHILEEQSGDHDPGGVRRQAPPEPR